MKFRADPLLILINDYFFCENLEDIFYVYVCKTKIENDNDDIQQNCFKYSSTHVRARELTDNFISHISLSISSMKPIIKSTSLCLYICSVCKFVTRKLTS